MMKKGIQIFCSYAHEDQDFFNDLEKHLKSLQWKGSFTIWTDATIPPGSDREDEIKTHLDEAQIILLLISPDFIASGYCHQEMTLAMEKLKQKQTYVIPIILRRVHWKHTPLGILQALPEREKPINSWKDRDEAFCSTVEGIYHVAKKLMATPPISSPNTELSLTALSR
jgi:TIR domain